MTSERADSALDGEHVPSPLERVRKQVTDYEATAGVQGGTLEGRPVVILTSVAAKSGLVRKNPVMRIVDGDRYVAVASDEGAPTNPSWYANLVAHPRVRLQDGAVVRELRGREVRGDEKRYYWTVATPDQVFAEYEVHPTAVSTGRRVNHLFMGRCVVRDGQIVLLREALNTVAAAQALLPSGPAELAPRGSVVNSH